MEVHKCQFIEWQPTPILSLSFHPSNELIAVGRENGDVEIWQHTDRWFLKQIFPGGDEVQIQTLLWVGERLFMAGLSGNIVEYDTISGLPKKYSGRVRLGVTELPPIWRLAKGPTVDGNCLLAAACDDGVVRIFSVEEDEPATFLRSCTTTEGKTLSVAWSVDGTEIYSGTDKGSIHRFDVKTGRSIDSVVVRHQSDKGNQKPMIWSLASLPDSVVVAGDSLGFTSLWDMKFGTALHSFQEHQGPVMAIDVHKDSSVILSSGVDSKIATFQLVGDKEKQEWTNTVNNRYMHQDVKCIAYSADCTHVVIGGADCHLFIGSTPNGIIEDSTRLSYLPTSRHTIAFCAEKNLLLSFYPHNNVVELWKLGKASKPNGNAAHRTNLSVSTSPERLLVVKPKGNTVCTAAISPDGKHIALSDNISTRVFQVTRTRKDTNYTLKRLSLKDQHGKKLRVPSSKIVFSPDSKQAVFGSFDGQVFIFNLETQSVSHVLSIGDSQHSITHLKISNNQQLLAVGNSNNEIEIFDLNKFKKHATLPEWNAQFNVFAFTPDDSILVVVCFDNSFHFYDVNKREVNSWNKEKKALPQTIRMLRSPIAGIAFNPAMPDYVIFWNEMVFFHVNMNADPPTQSHPINFKMIGDFYPLLWLDFTGPNQMVTVVRHFSEVIDALPKALARKRFENRK